ncbi:hypothetical protein G7Z17_g1956 [Cylindrodendrum hubeiense]|uniref:C6 transcription factor n=1 Tax=Cylindrodendrum hubeiense TaxID=595255 RepID=A0A9P5HF38_9HYPO|nr:hypothetical protein G7Z17_g1956 [Cylindrodendrum hubeiense]
MNQNSSVTNENLDERLAQQIGLSPGSIRPPCEQTPILPSEPSKPSGYIFNLDLEMLRYFHHFTTTTSLTLPAQHSEPAKHWQVDVVAQALHLRWLMCGLLAISTSHLAVLSDSETVKLAHRDRSAQFIQEFYAGWGQLRHDSGVAGSEEAKAGAQIICIHRCCYWTTESPITGQGIIESEPFQLQSFMMTVQGCVDSGFALHSATSNSNDISDHIPDAVSESARIDSGARAASGAAGAAPPELLERLRTLPFRMVDPLEKPENALDFFATVSALNILAKCCSLSYASDDVGAVWMGMASWLTKLPDRFKQMLSHGNSATLIVLAHWLLLVERAECYSWFLKGLATKLHRQIVIELPENSAIQSLVDNLLA